MSNPTRSFDVAVVGGGVIGLAVAWRAVQSGFATVVLERDQVGAGASRVAAGMLAPISEARAIEQSVLRLGLASARLYPKFIEELVEASGHDPGYLACGTIEAARDRDEAEALNRELALRQSLGLPVRRLLPSDARQLEPSLAPVLRLALEVPDDHAIDPRRLTAALKVAAENSGARVSAGAEVAEVMITTDRAEGVRLSNGELVRAEQVVIAAGAWCGRLGGIPDDARVPVRPVKGQVLTLHDPSGPGLLTRALRMEDAYVVPRGDGRYVIGATVEERGFDTTVNAGPVFELLRETLEMLPGASELVIDELTAGLRPTTPDSAPAMGPGAVSGLLWATGHYRHGVQLTPISAEIVARYLRGEQASELAAPFSPMRFATTAVRA